MRTHPEVLRIAFVELDYHSEVLVRAAEIFRRPMVEANFFTRASIASKAGIDPGKPPAHWFVAGVHEPAVSFLLRHLASLRSHDVIVLNTLDSNMWLIAALPLAVPMYLRVHNVNATFAPARSLSLPSTPLLCWKGFSHCVRRELLRQDWLARRLVMRRLTGILFPTSTMAATANLLTKGSSPLYFGILPLAAYMGPHQSAASNLHIEPIFCIPGSIDERRRDYQIVLEALQMVANHGTAMTICLLGAPVGRYGREVVRRVRALQRGRMRTVVFDGFVDNATFDHWLFGASALIAPTRRHTRFAIYRETYGRSKISGTETDAIRAGKPCIYPHWYTPDQSLTQASIHYSDSGSLAEQLLRFTELTYRNRMATAATAACEQYRASAIISRLISQMRLHSTSVPGGNE